MVGGRLKAFPKTLRRKPHAKGAGGLSHALLCVPIRWTRLIEKESPKFKELAQVGIEGVDQIL
jgi:hypothetical protein